MFSEDLGFLGYGICFQRAKGSGSRLILSEDLGFFDLGLYFSEDGDFLGFGSCFSEDQGFFGLWLMF